ncbi:MAG: type II 3-dehydroquinate dehydratase [Candidatus Marinimicrobia bacterium]|nr:type II 3-dehydroquinate dehydratase [Candidatus Neomarinimicrobiota bacterium]|tara:strand:+ start:163 stop:600 length:438 start_codon:yes stop_codon:yes gene_type:complete
MKILVLNGPNLNLLGIRDPEVYGYESLNDLENWLNKQPETDNCTLSWFQTNHEGHLIDKIHSVIGNNTDGIIINPGALTHYSYALRDAIDSVEIPTVEVHLSNIYAREDFRKKSVIKDVCIGQLTGLGKKGYLQGFQMLLKYLNR